MDMYKDQIYYVVGCDGASCMFDSCKLPASLPKDERLKQAYRLSDRLEHAGYKIVKFAFLNCDDYLPTDLPF